MFQRSSANAMAKMARDGRPMTSISSSFKIQKDIQPESKLDESYSSCEFDVQQQKCVDYSMCARGFLLVENSESTSTECGRAIIPFIGGLFGSSENVQGPLAICSPAHADNKIENEVQLV